MILVEKMGSIDIGRQGENLARTIQIDVSSLLAKWPDAIITMLVKRKTDVDPYFANTTVMDGILSWPITNVETAVVGDGKIEIQAISGNVIEKSVIGSFRVTSSLSGSVSTEIPDIRPSWVDELLAVAQSGITDPCIAHQQLVSDADGKAVWEDRLAYKYVAEGEVEILPETLLLGDDDNDDGEDDTFFVPIAWAIDPVAGNVCTVTYNGTPYSCEALPYEQEDIPEGCVILGNATLMGLSGGNTDAPFSFLCIPKNVAESLGAPYYAMGIVSDGATEVTLSVAMAATVNNVKTIDPDLLPDNVKRNPITLTISSSSIISDTPFAEAWKLSAADLQSTILLKEDTEYKGQCISTVDTVCKCSGALSGLMQDFISIRYRTSWIDTSDMSDVDVTRVLQWTASGIVITARYGTLPYDYNGSMPSGCYLRYNGNNNWQIATIDDLKADLGLTE